MNALVALRNGPEAIRPMFKRADAQTSASSQTSTTALKSSSMLKSASTTDTTDTASRNVTSELSNDTFLQLLVLQMQNQDPLDPMSNEDMLAQLAQFSSLEQMNNLNDSFETLSGNIDQLNFISATSLLGQHVTGVSTSGESLEGTVDEVYLDGSVVYLTVNGELMSMAGVMGIGDSDATSSTETTGAEKNAGVLLGR